MTDGDHISPHDEASEKSNHPRSMYPFDLGESEPTLIEVAFSTSEMTAIARAHELVLVEDTVIKKRGLGGSVFERALRSMPWGRFLVNRESSLQALATMVETATQLRDDLAGRDISVYSETGRATIEQERAEVEELLEALGQLVPPGAVDEAQ